MSRKMKLFSRKSAAPGVSEPSALKHMEIADAKAFSSLEGLEAVLAEGLGDGLEKEAILLALKKQRESREDSEVIAAAPTSNKRKKAAHARSNSSSSGLKKSKGAKNEVTSPSTKPKKKSSSTITSPRKKVKKEREVSPTSTPPSENENQESDKLTESQRIVVKVKRRKVASAYGVLSPRNTVNGEFSPPEEDTNLEESNNSAVVSGEFSPPESMIASDKKQEEPEQETTPEPTNIKSGEFSPPSDEEVENEDKYNKNFNENDDDDDIPTEEKSESIDEEEKKRQEEIESLYNSLADASDTEPTNDKIASPVMPSKPPAKNSNFRVSVPSKPPQKNFTPPSTPPPKPSTTAFPPSKPTENSSLVNSQKVATPSTPPPKPSVSTPKAQTMEQNTSPPVSLVQSGNMQKVGTAAPKPILPPKPGTQKVVGRDYKSAKPTPCPEDVYKELEDLISKEDPRKRFINLVEIGQGSSGTVAVGTDITTGKQVAVKKMILSKGINQIFVVKAEIMFMKMSQHKNIIGYIESYIVNNVLWCVMEYMEAGDLTELIRTSRKIMSERHIAIILREILEGLNYLHTQPFPIMHRDIKSDNILLGKDGTVKITDFGFACQLTPERRSRSDCIGTACWMPPEVIKGQEYATKVDVWSFGIIAQELVDGEPPYYFEPTRQIMMNIATKGRSNFKEPGKLSPEFKNFVKQCTITDYRTRPRACDLLKHPFLLKHADGVLDEITPLITAMIATNTIKFEAF